MKANLIFHQKLVLNHEVDSERLAILEIVVWEVPISRDYPNGIKYRAWFVEDDKTLFGFDNHKPKGPHLHIRDLEVGYVFRGLEELKLDVIQMVKKEGFIYESK